MSSLQNVENESTLKSHLFGPKDFKRMEKRKYQTEMNFEQLSKITSNIDCITIGAFFPNRDCDNHSIFHGKECIL